ncbi:GlsB/YeaQ/YmgE family stress response membrane protein [Cellulomonas sp. URHE0023]|uniref:GlsB/YeaQ/YmgE family stress response membrane protein n=1 Tax=Cellulomonas sp. URHE0023 TaxID=1380354 RepID=UPI00048A0DC4|nr:GlsB/YeaQ/YmgE family stress response membrane protein [Cellulomonas sp. URHE0023]
MTQHSLLSAILIGAIVGILGRLLVRGKQRISWLVTLLVGIVAALVGTWLATLIGVRDTGGVDWIEVALQVGLAAVFVAAVSGRRRRRSIL